MSSKKPAANAKRIQMFKTQLRDTYDESDPFTSEKIRLAKDSEQREAIKRKKTCESKNRYMSRIDAQEAIDLRAEHGIHNLHYYQCPYCNGWHITSKKEMREDEQ